MPSLVRKYLPRVGLGLGVLIAALSIALLLVCAMPGDSFHGKPSNTPADDLRAARLRADVEHLANRIGERRLGHRSSLDAARAFLSQRLSEAGYQVMQYPFEARGGTAVNLVVERRGTLAPEEILIVGAHYDTARGTPGANDDATGVAAVLELARIFAAKPTAQTLRFVLFANEEPPYFQSEDMGSLVYARSCVARREQIVGMLALESLGHFTSEPGSQRFPWPLGHLYPDAGDFVAFVGNLSSRSLVREVVRRFRERATIPSEGLSAPAVIEGVGWSDHWSFWQADYRALMVTDTAIFRDPAYHQAFDTAERVHYGALARVVDGLVGVIDGLVASRAGA